jgi:hypothetical protein
MTKIISFYVSALTLVVGFCTQAYAAVPADLSTYYPTVLRQALEHPLSNQEMKKILFNVLNMAHVKSPQGPDELQTDCSKNTSVCYQQRALSYKEARIKMFGELHLIQRGGNHYAIRDVYCARDLEDTAFPRGQGPAPGRIPSVQVLNTEHTWPQSKFSRNFPKGLQKGDLHILYPVQSNVNSIRSNDPFGNVGTPTQTPCPEAKRGYSGQSGHAIFEPADEHKGNVARAMFYFSVRYKMPIDAEQEAVLRQWDRLDPVDAFERARNERIFEIQGNRNPFIDDAELSSLISDF